MVNKILVPLFGLILVFSIFGFFVEYGKFNASSNDFIYIHMLQKIFWIIGSTISLFAIYMKRKTLLTISLTFFLTATVYHLSIISILLK